MARTRSIRPGFFTNDALGELPAVVRLLFAGLWTVADRDGRLLDRPRKLKAELLAYDNVNIDKALNDLAGKGFIERYQVGEERCIQIHNWHRHQRPHPREEASTVPAPEGYPGSTPEPDQGAPSAVARPRPGPPGTLSSSSSSSSSSGSDPSGAAAAVSTGPGLARARDELIPEIRPQGTNGQQQQRHDQDLPDEVRRRLNAPPLRSTAC